MGRVIPSNAPTPAVSRAPSVDSNAEKREGEGVPPALPSKRKSRNSGMKMQVSEPKDLPQVESTASSPRAATNGAMGKSVKEDRRREMWSGGNSAHVELRNENFAKKEVMTHLKMRTNPIVTQVVSTA